MAQEAEIVGVTDNGHYLQIRSTHPKEWFGRGGCRYGYRFEYEMNHYVYQTKKEHLMDYLGLTEQSYQYWDAKFLCRYNLTTGEWY